MAQAFQNLLCRQAVGSGFRIGNGQSGEGLFRQVVLGIPEGVGRRTPERQLAPGIGEAGSGDTGLIFLNQCRPERVLGPEDNPYNVLTGSINDGMSLW